MTQMMDNRNDDGFVFVDGTINDNNIDETQMNLDQNRDIENEISSDSEYLCSEQLNEEK
eukprot:CAMPEP_0201594574 /NCGR_PEP_ID=MMETSP0190_2-20130828/191852_1 /ASSEMBLY_ACC=CAM_ASM_000263 /TAXON_ID=37353 /ORGANISM="Rosalina sp." /LENGTH=58 /DNA_ID=CAMNT_0048054243 /DNA_START=1041 /DNA_END=1214 /DNA_ORIENTATION=+